MDLLSELKKQLANKNDFLANGPSTEIGQEWLSRTKELIAKVDHGMSREFDDLGRKSALPLSAMTMDPMLARMIVILRNAIHYLDLSRETPSNNRKSEAQSRSPINQRKNIHWEYWSEIYSNIRKFHHNNRRWLWAVIVVIVLLSLAYLGRVEYTPEISTWIGKFSAAKEFSVTIPMNKSIFDVANEIRGMTSNEQVIFIKKFVGLRTIRESGTIFDIGTDNRYVLIYGKNTGGLVSCYFNSEWSPWFGVAKKDMEINFAGTVSGYNLGRGWVELNDCDLFPQQQPVNGS